MKIAIIGSGNVGGALAQSLIKAGHTVIVGIRFPASRKSVELMAKIGEDRFMDWKSAVKQCETVIVTTPPDSIIDLLDGIKRLNLSDKIFIDASNSITKKPEGFATAYHAIKAAGIDHVAKCFNTTGFENMLNPVYQDSAADMFCAGNSERAKKTAMKLSSDIGFGKCYDFGGDDKAELLEQLAFCWINLAIMQKEGRHIAFKILRK